MRNVEKMTNEKINSWSTLKGALNNNSCNWTFLPIIFISKPVFAECRDSFLVLLDLQFSHATFLFYKRLFLKEFRKETINSF